MSRWRDEPKLLTAREAAAYLGVSKKGLAKLVRSGRLPRVRSGRRIRFRRDDLDELIDSTPGVFIKGFLAGVSAVGLILWSAHRRGRRTALRSDRGGGRRLRAVDTELARQEQLTELFGLLKAHYASTRFISALLVLNNRRKRDRRKVDIPVAVDRRSGKDRRADPNLDAEVARWRRRLGVG